ncbi:MAG: indole-3-glycerol phosphate synthase TrpC [Bacteroidota bacterium]
MSDRLAEIIDHKREEVKLLEPLADELRKQALERNDFRNFRQVLFQPGSTTIIAEVKKASPSAGVISHSFDPVNQAREYERGGANALSILTDQKFFQGHLEYLRDVRDQVDLPLLRKDFTISPLQVYESVVAGSDAILLIVAALNDDELKSLYELALSVQLDVLVEVHDMREMDRALDLGADMIGINNRNLKTFEVDLKTTDALAPEIPNDVLGISESGIKTADDVKKCQEQGIFCFLIGETLMRAKSVPDKIKELRQEEE